MNPRAASRRAQERSAEGHRDALVVLASVVVLAVAAVIVLAGLYFTRYRPPRESALTVDGSTYTAAQVERNLLHLLLYDTAAVGTDQTQIVAKTLDRLEREEILRRRAPALVGDVDAAALAQHLRTSLLPPASPAPTMNTPGVTIALPTATPMSDEEFATALQTRLRAAGMKKDEIDTIARADALEARLRERFRAELSASGAQLQLVVARLSDRAKAEQVRAIGLRPGVDFVPVASVNSVGGVGPTGDLAWVLPEELKQSVREVVQALQPGGISEVTANGIYFEVYKVVAVEASRKYQPDQLDALVEDRVTKWLEAERPQVTFGRVLSADTEQWIREQALAAFRARNAQPGG